MNPQQHVYRNNRVRFNSSSSFTSFQQQVQRRLESPFHSFSDGELLSMRDDTDTDTESRNTHSVHSAHQVPLLPQDYNENTMSVLDIQVL